MTSPLVAIKGYQAGAALAKVGAGAPVSAGAKVEGGFSDFVQEKLHEVSVTGRQAEQKSAQYIQGSQNLIDVVTAVSETEVALETVVAVRDKVISAYEEIMRMPI